MSRGAPSRSCTRLPGARQRGFTLLEAVVAMVLISSAGLALFAWINGGIIALGRVQDANARSEATLNAVEYVDRVNPMLTPEGQVSFGAYRIRWRATPITAVQDGTNYPMGIGLYQFALYDTQVTVEQNDGRSWFDFSVRQVGYKKVRALQIAP